MSRALSPDRRKAKTKAASGQGDRKSTKAVPGRRRVAAGSGTLDLFGAERLPQGLKYQAEFISLEEERRLLRDIEVLPCKEFEFHGFTGKRRTVSFGWRYDFNGGGLSKTEDMPTFLASIRAQAEMFAGNAPGSFQQVLVTEYSPEAGIGWHKDRSVFGDVVGISLLSPCTFRLRKRTGKGFERQTLIVEPRSVYLLRGVSRTEWEHSLPGVESLRYSLTFRNVLERGG